MPGRTHKLEAKYNVTTEFPHLGLHAAAATGNVGLVEYALSHGQPVNSVLDGVLPLHAAASGGNELVVKLLIECGADVNAPRLPRHHSSSSRSPGHSSHPIVGTSGSTPLHFAAANGHTGVVRILLLRGARVDRADKHNVTPEILARRAGWKETAEVLRVWGEERELDLIERERGVMNREKEKAKDLVKEREGEPENERDASVVGAEGVPVPNKKDRQWSVSSDTLEQSLASSFRQRLRVKRSIDNALQLFKSGGGSSTDATRQPSSSSATGTEFFMIGDSDVSAACGPTTFADLPSPFSDAFDEPLAPAPARDQLLDPYNVHHATRRPSLPQLLDSHAHGAPGLGTTYVYSRKGRPCSAGTGADRSEHPGMQSMHSLHNMQATTGAGTGSAGTMQAKGPRKLGSKLSLLNLFKKANFPASQNSSGDAPVSTPHSDPASFSSACPLQAQSSQTALVDRLAVDATLTRTDTPGSVASGASVVSTPDSVSLSASASGSASEIALAQGQVQRPGILRGHQQRPSSSGLSGNVQSSGGHMSRHTRMQPSPPSARTLRFEHEESRETKVGTATDGQATRLRSRSGSRSRSWMREDSRGERGRANGDGNENKEDQQLIGSAPASITSFAQRESFSGQVNSNYNGNYKGKSRDVNDDSFPRNGSLIEGEEKDLDEEEEYGELLSDPTVIQPVFQTPLQHSHTLGRPRNHSTASDPSSLLQSGGDEASSVPGIHDCPFSTERPPPAVEAPDYKESVPEDKGEEGGRERIRGDSVSSTSTTGSGTGARGIDGGTLQRPRLSSSVTTASGGSVPTPAPSYMVLLHSLDDSDKYESMHFIDSQRSCDSPSPITIPVYIPESTSPSRLSGGSVDLCDRRGHSPLGISIRTISSHAQAEELVQRAQQSILDMELLSDDVAAAPGLDRTPLSAKLAAYGESLAIERRLKMEEGRERERTVVGSLSGPPVHSGSGSGLLTPDDAYAAFGMSSLRDSPSSRSRYTATYESVGADGKVRTLDKKLSLDHVGAASRSGAKVRQPKRPSTSSGIGRTHSFGTSSRSDAQAGVNAPPSAWGSRAQSPESISHAPPPQQEPQTRIIRSSSDGIIPPAVVVEGPQSSIVVPCPQVTSHAKIPSAPIPFSHHPSNSEASDYTRTRTPDTELDDKLSCDSHTRGVPLARVSTAPLQYSDFFPRRGKNSRLANSAAKLTRMGFSTADGWQTYQAVSMTPTGRSPGGKSRFGIKSLMQSFKSK